MTNQSTINNYELRAEELRIGNLIDTEDGPMWIQCIRMLEGRYVVDVLPRFSSGRGRKVLPIEAVESIKLTPEILEKAGFEDMGKGHPPARYKCKPPFSYVITHFESEPEEFVFGDLTPIRYVHDLQNLFWCLTGDELDLQL